MSTIVINAWSIAFPLITNRIRVDISTQLSPLAIVATQTVNAPHPVRIWSFPGLVRTNYVFSMNEIDGAGVIVRNLAYFDIVPGNLDGVLVRGEEQIKVGVTVGLVAGATGFVFDGTAGKPDWRGWVISPEEYSGVGTLILGQDYTWDKETGSFAYINGQVMQPNQWFTVEFEAQAGGAGGSVPNVIDFATRIITANTTLTPADFGEKLIIEPSGLYLELTFPPIATVVAGRALMVETKAANEFRCVKFIFDGSDQLKFMFGSLYMMMNEKLYIYKLERGVGVYEWRVFNEQGNFINCGELVSSDMASVFNRILMNGSSFNKLQFARIYNEVILRLPIGQRVNYDDWSTNQTFYSLANSSNPANANLFRVPNRVGLVEKNSDGSRLVGSFEDHSVGPHTHFLQFYGKGVLTFAGNELSLTPDAPNAPGGLAPVVTSVTGSGGFGITGETKVKNYSANKYILV